MATPVWSQSKPNILLILTDDMGYGDPSCFNPKSKIPTPNIDRLANEGRRFTDAHTAASWCTPSRYGLMTGQSPHRTTWDTDKRSIIDPTRLTMGKMLRQSGYHTGMIGKWHLGFDTGNRFDCGTQLQGGPRDRGFDYFFGIHASLDIPPYFYIENRNCVAAPEADVAAGATPGWSPIQGAFWREGKIASGFAHADVQPTLLRKSSDFLKGHKASRPQDPFFLYLAMTGPHTPWVPPHPAGKGNGAGLYGDFVSYVDEGVGQILGALDSLGYGDNTLVIFSSDNGPVWYPENTAKYGHAAAGYLRGMKLDGWEGGSRVPLITRWPGRIPRGTESGQLISLTDMLATLASVANFPLPDNAGEDSYNMLPALLDLQSVLPLRDAVVTSGGYMTVRKEKWKLVLGLGSGGFSEPKNEPIVAGGPRGQLFNLAVDSLEQNNLWLGNQAKVASLTALLNKYDAEGRSIVLPRAQPAGLAKARRGPKPGWAWNPHPGPYGDGRFYPLRPDGRLFQSKNGRP